MLTLNVSANALGGHLGHGDWLPATFWADADGDGFGDAASPIAACLQPAGTATTPDDCNDGDGAVNPDEAEVPYDGLDNDCDGGTPDDDLDGDGFGIADDCDDANDAVNPGEAEVPYDGLDNDCDGGTPDDDLDGDGFGIADDCDDADNGVNPGATELCDDALDNDCDDAIDEDCGGACDDVNGAELVHYWPLDGDGLDQVGAKDFSAFGNVSWVGGYDGAALRINSQGGGAVTSDLLSQFADGPFTVSAWVNYHGDFTGHVRHEHVFFSTDDDRSRDLDLFAERNGTQTFAWVQGHVTQFFTGAGASWIIQQDQWHHIVLGRDASGTQYLCEDGTQTGSNSSHANFQHTPAASFYLGRNTYDNGGRSFPGAFDDVRVYDGWIGADGCVELSQATCN